MPKLQRTPEEIEQVKAHMLEKAAQLIIDLGYHDFTMRKLAAKLNITATTIYNYYQNKDDLFIHLLIMGFSELVEQLEAAYRSHTGPRERLKSMISVYTDYGLANENFYNLMYTWHVPKFNTYAGTALEPSARQQLEIALKVPGIFASVIRDYAAAHGRAISEEEVQFLLIHYWSHIHGFIAGCNNSNLSYIHDNPLSLKEKHLNGIAEKFRADISHLSPQGEEI